MLGGLFVRRLVLRNGGAHRLILSAEHLDTGILVRHDTDLNVKRTTG